MNVDQRVVILAIVAAVFGGANCKREERPFRGLAEERSHLGLTVLSRSRGRSPYAENAWGMSEGQRLYAQMNCAGCHAHGGGGMGPPLMDGKWIYGFDDAAIFETIARGRPNGMPAYGDRLNDDQIWKLVAFVKSLGGHAPAAAAAARDDHMAVAPGPARVGPQPLVEQKP
jgi:cytochrome c oxidase cbb3-type subunit 3